MFSHLISEFKNTTFSAVYIKLYRFRLILVLHCYNLNFLIKFICSWVCMSISMLQQNEELKYL